MAQPLKDLYDQSLSRQVSNAMQYVDPGFDAAAFVYTIFSNGWEQLELKQRMRRFAQGLNAACTGSFSENMAAILRMIDYLRSQEVREYSIEYMFIPDYVELYGVHDFEISVNAMEVITQFTSCEFAVRPFLLQYPTEMMAQMQRWAYHEQVDVRRFASEGCRPRLPWAMAIPYLKEDPSPILPILEQLKNDPSEYVRRSVANNLNDISKDHPDLVKRMVKKWLGQDENVEKVVKHGSRTLLKQGDPEVMAWFGFAAPEELAVDGFSVLTPRVSLGDALEFSFRLSNESDQMVKVRLEYALYLLRGKGQYSRKVFKVSEREYAGGESQLVFRKQSFRPVTTRRYYPGTHQVALIVNGVEQQKHSFELVE
jgi:3-methyladenine DNA glycosylase AlkC